MKCLTFTITGLSCPACKKLTEKRIYQIPGVVNVSVDLSLGNALVETQKDLTPEEINKALEGTPYKVIK